jgi:hypothetical protein
MPQITITEYARGALRSCRATHETAHYSGRGLWNVELTPENYSRFRKVQFPGETDSDTLVRLVADYRGQVS